MALASLTIDLTVGLARFEGDVSRITQIATRESERLERARQSLLKQLEREAETAGRSRGEVLALKAAYLGLTEQASKYIEKIAEGERRSATVAGGDAITQAASREIAANAQRSNSQRELVQSINAVAVAYQKQQRDLIQSLASGQITPDSFKAQIAAAQESAKAAVQDIRTKAAQFGMILSEDVVQYIAENITSNVRQLEGVVKRLTAYRDILDDTITVDSDRKSTRLNSSH